MAHRPVSPKPCEAVEDYMHKKGKGVAKEQQHASQLWLQQQPCLHGKTHPSSVSPAEHPSRTSREQESRCVKKTRSK